MRCPDCSGRRTIITESDGKELIEKCYVCNGSGSVDMVNGSLSETSPLNESAKTALEEFMNKRISD